MSRKFTTGPWEVVGHSWQETSIYNAKGVPICGLDLEDWGVTEDNQDELEAEQQKVAHLIAAAPTQHAEMVRYLPIIERAEADPELWKLLTEGTGIATANGYRAVIAKAKGEPA